MPKLRHLKPSIIAAHNHKSPEEGNKGYTESNALSRRCTEIRHIVLNALRLPRTRLPNPSSGGPKAAAVLRQFLEGFFYTDSAAAILQAKRLSSSAGSRSSSTLRRRGEHANAESKGNQRRGPLQPQLHAALFPNVLVEEAVAVSSWLCRLVENVLAGPSYFFVEQVLPHWVHVSSSSSAPRCEGTADGQLPPASTSQQDSTLPLLHDSPLGVWIVALMYVPAAVLHLVMKEHVVPSETAILPPLLYAVYKLGHASMELLMKVARKAGHGKGASITTNTTLVHCSLLATLAFHALVKLLAHADTISAAAPWLGEQLYEVLTNFRVEADMCRQELSAIMISLKDRNLPCATMTPVVVVLTLLSAFDEATISPPTLSADWIRNFELVSPLSNDGLVADVAIVYAFNSWQSLVETLTGQRLKYIPVGIMRAVTIVADWKWSGFSNFLHHVSHRIVTRASYGVVVERVHPWDMPMSRHSNYHSKRTAPQSSCSQRTQEDPNNQELFAWRKERRFPYQAEAEFLFLTLVHESTDDGLFDIFPSTRRQVASTGMQSKIYLLLQQCDHRNIWAVIVFDRFQVAANEGAVWPLAAYGSTQEEMELLQTLMFTLQPKMRKPKDDTDELSTSLSSSSLGTPAAPRVSTEDLAAFFTETARIELSLHISNLLMIRAGNAQFIQEGSLDEELDEEASLREHTVLTSCLASVLDYCRERNELLWIPSDSLAWASNQIMDYLCFVEQRFADHLLALVCHPRKCREALERFCSFVFEEKVLRRICAQGKTRARIMDLPKIAMEHKLSQCVVEFSESIATVSPSLSQVLRHRVQCLLHSVREHCSTESRVVGGNCPAGRVPTASSRAENLPSLSPSSLNTQMLRSALVWCDLPFWFLARGMTDLFLSASLEEYEKLNRRGSIPVANSLGTSASLPTSATPPISVAEYKTSVAVGRLERVTEFFATIISELEHPVYAPQRHVNPSDRKKNLIVAKSIMERVKAIGVPNAALYAYDFMRRLTWPVSEKPLRIGKSNGRQLNHMLSMSISIQHNHDSIRCLLRDMIQCSPFERVPISLLWRLLRSDIGLPIPDKLEDHSFALFRTKKLQGGKFRALLAQFPLQQEAAGLLKDVGGIALNSLKTWMSDEKVIAMNSLTLPGQSTSPSSSSFRRFCLDSIRTSMVVDALQMDWVLPLQEGGCLQVLQHMNHQCAEWLCMEGKKHLIAFLCRIANREQVVAAEATLRNTPHAAHPFVLPRRRRRMVASNRHCPFVTANSEDITMGSEFRPFLFQGGNPLEATASMLLLLEDMHWCYATKTLFVRHQGDALETATSASLCAAVVVPWALAASSSPPTSVWGVQCTFLARTHPPMASQGRGGGSAQLASGIRSSVASLTSFSSLELVPLPTLIHWWNVEDVVTARWVAHQVFTFTSKKAGVVTGGQSVIVQRARTAILTLLRRFGSRLFQRSTKGSTRDIECVDYKAFDQIPKTLWLPVLEEVLSIAKDLLCNGDVIGSQLLLECIVEPCMVNFSHMCVWPLLFDLHASGQVQKQAKASLKRNVGEWLHRIEGILSLSKTRPTSSSAQALCVIEAATALHKVMRGLAVLPFEQLNADVALFQKALSLERESEGAEPPPGAVDPQKCHHLYALAHQTLHSHLKEFANRTPSTELERYLRIELLAFVEPTLALLSSSSIASVMVKLFPNYAATLKDLQDKLSEITRKHMQLSMTSVIGHHSFQQVSSLLKRQGVCLLDFRDVIHLHPALWGTHSKHLSAVELMPVVTIFPSVQRPKRITVQTLEPTDDASGGTAKRHFLIKGNEDMRQDQRIQRLIRLYSQVSGCLLTSYSVVPLTVSSGLVEWVPNSETMGRLIQQYRQLSGLPQDRELKLLQDSKDRHLYLNYDSITNAEDKLTLFRKIVPQPQHYSGGSSAGPPSPNDKSGPSQALSPLYGQGVRPPQSELCSMLVYKAPTASAYIANRTIFTKSLASMSIIGYWIGLGDRHPSNLLINGTTSQITHIDFGDIFERARTRHKLPERVPFRATRMLERCVDVYGFSGGGGLFLHECTQIGCSLINDIATPTHAGWGKRVMPTESDTRAVDIHRGYLLIELLLPFLHTDRQVVGAERDSNDAASDAIRGVASRLQRFLPLKNDRPSLCHAADKMIAYRMESKSKRKAHFEEQRQVAASALQAWWRKCRATPTRLACKKPSDMNEIFHRRTAHHAALDDDLLDGTFEQFSPRDKSLWSEDRTTAIPTSKQEGLRESSVAHDRRVRQVVKQLISEAVSDENYALHFSGWMPFW